MPRRRRGSAEAIAAEADAERGLVLRILLHSPKDTVAGMLAFAAIVAIVANALFLQAGPHPSPMFGSIVTMPAPAQTPVSPLPRPRPAEATRSEAAPTGAQGSGAEGCRNKACGTEGSRRQERRSPDQSGQGNEHGTDRDFLDPASAGGDPGFFSQREHAGPGGSRRVAAVQRALTEYGYGQLKPTGTIGPDTQAAIVKFERERKIPATGR